MRPGRGRCGGLGGRWVLGRCCSAPGGVPVVSQLEAAPEAPSPFPGGVHPAGFVVSSPPSVAGGGPPRARSGRAEGPRRAQRGGGGRVLPRFPRLQGSEEAGESGTVPEWKGPVGAMGSRSLPLAGLPTPEPQD